MLDQRPLTLVPIGLVSVYGGYFGAGSGVLLLTLILIVAAFGLLPAAQLWLHPG